MHPRPLITAILLAWILLAPRASAQAQEPRSIPFEGPEIVCHILHKYGMEPLLTFEEAAKSPTKNVIILFGNPHLLPQTDRDFKEFLNGGGNLLIASDYAWHAPELSIHIEGTPISTPDRQVEQFAYRKKSKCPKLTYFEPDCHYRLRDGEVGHLGRDNRRHPLFRFLHKEIATNCPSHLRVLKEGSPGDLLLVFPFDDQQLNWRDDVRSIYMAGSPDHAPPQGRWLYIAGHGMFMNGMIVQTDSDNFDFTVNAVRWLQEGPKGQPRTKALFIVDGTVITNFDTKLTAPMPPIPLPTVRMLDRLARGLENEHVLQRVVKEALGDRAGRLIGVLLGLVTFVVLLYGAKKFMEGRHHLETAVPQLLGAPVAIASSDPAVQRQQAMLRKGDFWNEAQQLVLEWFRTEFDVTPEHWRAEVEAEFQAQGSFWAHRRLQRQAEDLLRMARATGPMSISRHSFFVLLDTLRELSAARQAGQLTLLVAGKNVRQS